MKKYFKKYLIVWIILLAAFNAVAFLIPAAPGTEKFTMSFWIAYVFIMLALIGQLICTYRAFAKSETKEALFLNMPVITISYTGMILTMIVGAVCALVPAIPGWIAAVAGIVITAVYAIAVIKAETAAEMITNIDSRVKEKTSFIRLLTVDAEAALGSINNPEIKSEAQKVYEAIRYSDPMSNEGLKEVEINIMDSYKKFKGFAEEGDTDKAKEAAADLVKLIGKRNAICKGLK